MRPIISFSIVLLVLVSGCAESGRIQHGLSAERAGELGLERYKNESVSMLKEFPEGMYDVDAFEEILGALKVGEISKEGDALKVEIMFEGEHLGDVTVYSEENIQVSREKIYNGIMKIIEDNTQKIRLDRCLVSVFSACEIVSISKESVELEYKNMFKKSIMLKELRIGEFTKEGARCQKQPNKQLAPEESLKVKVDDCDFEGMVVDTTVSAIYSFSDESAAINRSASGILYAKIRG